MDLYNKAEDNMEKGMQIGEEFEERRLNGLGLYDKYKVELANVGLEGVLKDDEASEQAVNIRYTQVCLSFKIDEIVQAWNEMFDTKWWQTGVPMFRLEPLFRRRVPKLRTFPNGAFLKFLCYVIGKVTSQEPCEFGETHELLSWVLRVQIALDVARGLEYLHDGAVPPVIHRDIKSSNILLAMGARVADFELSREDMINRNASNVQGTFGYLNPEYISTRTFTKKTDVYSFGVLLFELIAGRNPQQGLIDYIEFVARWECGRVG